MLKSHNNTTLTKSGTGTLTLTNANTYTGLTTISAGVLHVANNTALGTTAGGVSVTSGAALELDGSAGALTIGAEALALNGTGISSGGALCNIAGNNSYAGVITMGSASRINSDAGTLTIDSSGSITGNFGLTLGGAGNIILADAFAPATAGQTLTKDGTGTVTLSAANTYTGATTVSAGKLLVTGSLAGTAISVSGGASLGGGGTIGALNGTTGIVTLAAGANDAARGSLDLTNGAVGTLTFNNKSTATSVLVIGDATNASILAFDVGATSDRIALGTNARLNINAGGGLVRLTNLGGLAAGTQDLITSTTAKQGTGTLTLDATTGNFGGLNVTTAFSGNNYQLTATANAAPTTAYWKGSNDGVWNSFTGGNTNISNFATNLGGTNATGKVGATTDVIFNATAAANFANTTLGENLTIKSLTFGSNATSSVGIGGSNTLTITPASSATGITVATGSGNHTISSLVALGANQTWTVTDASQTLTASNQISGGFALTKAGAGSLTLSGANTYTGVTTISGGDVIVQNNTSLGTTAGGTTVASGAAIQINGSGLNVAEAITSLVGDGGGTGALQNLANNNTWSGAITLGTGGARINSDGGTLTLTGGITGAGNALTLGGAGNVTVSTTAIGGTNTTLTKDGVGTLTLSAANSYTGLTTVSAGTLTYGVSNALSSGAVTVAGGTLSLGTYSDAVGAVTLSSGSITGTTGVLTGTSYNLTDTGTVSAILAGAASLTKTGAGTATLSGANTYTAGTIISGGTLTLSGASGAINSSSGIAIGDGGTLKLDNTTNNNTTRIGNSAGVTLNGGTFAFTHAADTTAYSETAGALSINYGASTVSTDVSASGGSSILTFASLGRVAGAGATVNFGGGTGSPGSANDDNNVRFTSTPALTNGIIGTWATVGGANWATYTTGANASVGALATFTDVTRLSSGTKVIPNTSTANVRIIEGTGTAAVITLAAATTTINTLTQSTSGGSSAATIDLATRTLRVDGILAATGAGGLTIGTGTAINAGTLTRATTTAGGELILQAFSANGLTINSVIADNTNLSNLTKAGSGTVFLNGANTYSGVTTIDAGIVNVATLSNYGVAGSLGNRALTSEATTLVGIYLEGGTLQYTGSTAQSTDRNLRVGLNGGTIDASGGAGATMNFTHSTTNVDSWANPGSRTLTLTGTNTDNNTFAINLQEYDDGTSHTSLVKSGAGTWDLTNTHNSDAQTNSYLTFGGYGGGTTISGGTLGFANGAIGGGVVNITGNATLRWDTGNTQDITTGTGAGVARSVRIEDGVTATFNTNGNNVTLSNALQVGTLKTGAVTKDGAGTLTLSTANTYAGNTLVSGGTLMVNNTSGSGTGSGTVGVLSGATLGGTGIIAGATTIQSGGTHAPGVAGTPGTQTFGSSVTYVSGSIFSWDLNASKTDPGTNYVNAGLYDKVVATGAVTGTSVFNIVLGTNAFTDVFWQTSKQWNDIFTKGGSTDLALIFTTFGGSGVPTNGQVRGQGYNGNFFFTNNTLYWGATGEFVPEPTTALAGFLLAAGLLRRRR